MVQLNQRWLLIGSIGLVLALSSVGSAAQPAGPKLITEPPLPQVLPFEAEAAHPQQPTQFQLQVSAAANNTRVHLRLFAPAANPWLPTDFPAVEGTELLNLEATAAEGTVRFQQMLPIRGHYRLAIEPGNAVHSSASSEQTEQSLSFSIAENPVKYRNFAILAVILLAAGLLGGWVIGMPQKVQAHEIAPARVRLLLSGAMGLAIVALLAVNLSAEFAESHAHHHAEMEHGADAAAQGPEEVQSPHLQLVLKGDDSAAVGQLASFTVQAIDPATQQPVSNVRLKIRATQLEDHWVSFAYEGNADPSGQLTWQQQFFDGAPHRIEVEAIAVDGASATTAQEIDVEPVPPSLTTRLVALMYLMAILGVGTAFGFWLRRPPAAAPPKPIALKRS